MAMFYMTLITQISIIPWGYIATARKNLAL